MWTTMTGGITHKEHMGTRLTVFYIGAVGPAGRGAQRIAIDTERLERYPDTYAKTLDRMVRDISAMVDE